MFSGPAASERGYCSPRALSSGGVRSALAAALACPVCRANITTGDWVCQGCGKTYPQIDGAPALLRPDHPMLGVQVSGGAGRRPRWLRRPEDRVWSRQSKQAISRALDEADASDPDRLVVNLGAGFEPVFRKAFQGRAAVARIGLPHSGAVDVFGDMREFPLTDGSVDLFMSSSVMEHVADPERGVCEMARVVRPGGLVYAEIPFMRAYHMAPVDYQRYTISGIEQLFARHGFETVEKGVCSGPFTALALFFSDMSLAFARRRLVPRILANVLLRLLQPVKYLDRLVENSDAAIVNACNLYYLGRRT